MCLIFIQKEKWDRVIKFSQDILTSDPKNIKSLFRLSLAKLKTNDTISARSHITKVLEAEPQNPDAHALLAEIKKKEKETDQELKASMSKMFK